MRVYIRVMITKFSKNFYVGSMKHARLRTKLMNKKKMKMKGKPDAPLGSALIGLPG